MALHGEKQPKFSSRLVLVALLSGWITIAQSICYILLCVIAIIVRFDDRNCDPANPHTPSNSRTGWNLLHTIYFLSEDCDGATPIDNLTQSHTVFVLVILTMCVSVLTLVSSICLVLGMNRETPYRYLNVIVFVYVACWIGSLTVDLTFATHLGMDYGYLTQLLNDSSEYNYVVDIVRMGALLLMSLALKGFVVLVLNMVLIGLLLAYSCKYQGESSEGQHSIRKMGPLNAFEQARRTDDDWVNQSSRADDNWVRQPRRADDNWAQPEPVSLYASPYARGQTNSAYTNDNAQSRSLPRNELYPSSNQFSRSDSWHHQGASVPSRPFSYMEDPRRVPPSPAATAAPIVPAPDYSPHGPRRLKSALKPAGYL